MGGRGPALHPRKQVRDQRAGRLPPPRFRRARLHHRRHDQRRQDAALCDAVIVSFVVPAKAGTHNHRPTFCSFYVPSEGYSHLVTISARRMGPCFSQGRHVEIAMTKTPRSFGHVATWVFRPRQHAVPASRHLWQQVDARIGEFVSNWLKISPEKRGGCRRTITCATAPRCAA